MSREAMSRRELCKAGVAAAAGLVLTRRAHAAQAIERFAPPPPLNAQQRLLLRGGTIISLDPQVGNLVTGDVLIQGKTIAAIGPNLQAADAQVIDAQNMILIPGFVDCHRHSWEGQLRRINPNARTIAEYSNATHLSFAVHYRPLDHYVGHYLTALGCIDAGITCMIDNSHNSRSAAHSDAAVEALMDSGIRAVHASGAPQAGNWDRQWPQDLERLKDKYFRSDDQLLTLRMFSPVNRDNWAVARRLGLRITTEFQGPNAAMLLDDVWRDRLVGADNCFNHCGALPDRTWQILRESGATINVCPRSDAQYALGEGFPPYQRALDHGIRPGFSVDNETSYSTDMFAEMRAAFMMHRAILQNRRFMGEMNLPQPVSVRDVLECATINGANCAGLAHKIGTLAPGKEADIVMIRSDDINLYPSNNALGTVVQAAERSNIDTVIIGGRIRKRGGQVLGLDMNRLKRMVDESRRHLFAAVGYREDIFAETLPRLY
jgi:5-methylthioadenosine/S-adenosylhomocysteine deaminase